MAATLPNPAPQDAPSPRPTALSAVFRRLAGDTPSLPPIPRTEGFAEPAETVLPPDVTVYGFDDPDAPASAAATEPAVIATATDTAVPAPRAVEPKPEHVPPASDEPARSVPLPAVPLAATPPWPSPSGLPPRSPHIQARVRDLPVPPPVRDEAQNFADRLGRRLGEPSPSRRPAPDADFPPFGSAQFEPAEPVAEPPAQPAPDAVAPSPSPALDRAGRGSMPRNRRLHRRVKLPAELEIAGVACGLIDVSIGGFAATGAPELVPNTVVPVSLWLNIDGIEVGTRLNARVIYANETRSSGRFIDLSASQTAFLRYVVTWRGESVGVVGTTTLLDAIAGGPDRAEPGVDHGNGSTRERWWVGMIGRKVKPPR